MKSGPKPVPFDDVVRSCAARGMNLVGAIDAEVFDASQSCGRRARERMADCDTIIALATGGRSAWEAIHREFGPPGRPRPGRNPIDDWSRDVSKGVATRLRLARCRVAVLGADDHRGLNLRQLGEAVGFGTISPVIGHLLHPVYGPWLSVRAVLLVAGRPFGPRPSQSADDFEPCCTCSQPCVRACPSGVYAQPKPDVLRCARSRVAGACATGCDSLRACPIGREHRYGADEEAFRHAHSLFRARRWLGAGAWRFVPRFVRERR